MNDNFRAWLEKRFGSVDTKHDSRMYNESNMQEAWYAGHEFVRSRIIGYLGTIVQSAVAADTVELKADYYCIGRLDTTPIQWAATHSDTKIPTWSADWRMSWRFSDADDAKRALDTMRKYNAAAAFNNKILIIGYSKDDSQQTKPLCTLGVKNA